MKKIEIWTERVSSDCDTCGFNYDEGGTVFIDDVEVYRYDPVASCWGNANFSCDELLVKALLKLGIEVSVDGKDHYCLLYNEDLE